MNEEKWIPCGAFPGKGILAGRRACREGWRDRFYPDGERMDRLSVVASLDGDLFMQRETEEYIDGESLPFNSLEDMLANDWYLEPLEEK